MEVFSNPNTIDLLIRMIEEGVRAHSYWERKGREMDEVKINGKGNERSIIILRNKNIIFHVDD